MTTMPNTVGLLLKTRSQLLHQVQKHSPRRPHDVRILIMKFLIMKFLLVSRGRDDAEVALVWRAGADQRPDP